MARQKKYASAAERQAAYRERKKGNVTQPRVTFTYGFGKVDYVDQFMAWLDSKGFTVVAIDPPDPKYRPRGRTTMQKGKMKINITPVEEKEDAEGHLALVSDFDSLFDLLRSQ